MQTSPSAPRSATGISMAGLEWPKLAPHGARPGAISEFEQMSHEMFSMAARRAERLRDNLADQRPLSAGELNLAVRALLQLPLTVLTRTHTRPPLSPISHRRCAH